VIDDILRARFVRIGDPNKNPFQVDVVDLTPESTGPDEMLSLPKPCHIRLLDFKTKTKFNCCCFVIFQTHMGLGGGGSHGVVCVFHFIKK
jgi:hypothetical protein